MTISAYSTTAASNTTVNGLSIAEGCAPGNLNNMGREIMADLATFYNNDGQKFVGDVGIGVATPLARFHTETATAGDTAARINGVAAKFTVDLSGAGTSYSDATETQFRTFAGTVYGVAASTGWKLGSTSGTTAGGVAGAHEFYHATNTQWSSIVAHGSASAPFGLAISYPSAAPNSASSQFLLCADNSATRANIRSDGGISNYTANNVNLSDEREKKDIAAYDAAGNLAAFLGIQVVDYKYRDQTHDDFNLGVVAQQVRAVAPRFVDEDSWTKPNGETRMSVYDGDLHYQTMAQTQHAHRRIATLESRIAALEALIAAA